MALCSLVCLFTEANILLPLSSAFKNWIQLVGGNSKSMFRPLGRVYSWAEKYGIVRKREVFTRTGRQFMLLYKGFSLVFPRLEDPMWENCLVIFGTGYGSDLRRFVAIPSSESLCNLSPQQKSQMEVIVSFLVRIESNYWEGWGHVNWTNRE